MKRASYRDGIDWIARNDDTCWIDEPDADGKVTLSVTASLLADLFDVSQERVTKDIRRKLDQIAKEN